MAEQIQENKGVEQLDETREEETASPRTPLERILQSFAKARQGSKPPSSAVRKELGKDKSKSLFMLVGAAVVVLLFFLAVFSSPQKPKRADTGAHKGRPDLGQRVTPGQVQKQDGSVTPLLNADTREQSMGSTGQVTPEDINRTSHFGFQSPVLKPNTTANVLVPPAPATPTTSELKSPNGKQYELGAIDLSDPALQRQYAKAGFNPKYGPGTVPLPPVSAPNSEDDLKKPSLVFVRNESVNADARLVRADNGAVSSTAEGAEGGSLSSLLSAGTRLVARLQSPASTAAAAPVVAAIEYNYERDGEIVIPAGSKAMGKLQQANSSGYVSLAFDRIEFPDGTTEKMDGTSMGLDFAPVKGLVGGRRRGTRFLVQTLTGVGTAAAYLVGASNMSGPISESGLLRERMAENVGIAGQNELNQVAFNQNIVVTVPGNTRFYIVLQETRDSAGVQPASRRLSYVSRSTGEAQTPPSLEELRQLLQLRQELSQLYWQGEKPQASDSQNQQ
jgi:hypothetical protein